MTINPEIGNKPEGITRRDFLVGTAGLAMTSLLAACTDAPPQTTQTPQSENQAKAPQNEPTLSTESDHFHELGMEDFLEK